MNLYKKIAGTSLAFVMSVLPAFASVPAVFAAEPVAIEAASNGLSEELSQLQPVTVNKSTASAGESVSVSAAQEEGYYVAQIRIAYKGADDEVSYETISRQSSEASFEVPESAEQVTVLADYVPVAWDGTIDLTWYDPDQDVYTISYAAQWAGVAAFCNGLFNDIPTRAYEVGENTVQIPDITDDEGNQVGLISAAECTTDKAYNGKYYEGTVTDNDGSGYQTFADTNGDGYDTTVVGDLSKLKIRNSNSESSGSNNVFTTSNFWFGPETYTGKTILLDRDLDMGGILKEGALKTDPGRFAVLGKDDKGKDAYLDADGNVVTGDRLYDPNWTGPNYMPVGGGYVMDVVNGYTKLGCGFNGTLNGQGHMVDAICMMRHVYTGEFGNSQHTGLIGLLGSNYVELCPQDYPVVENVAVDGFMYGNRMVGAIVGETYHSKKLEIRNCMNFATVYNTDAKGCAGIVGSGIYSVEYGDPQPVIRNCANFGYTCTGYNKGGAGLVGYCESIVYDSYSVGYAGHDGNGEKEAAQSLGTNNGGAVWYNVYALKGASWHSVAGAEVVPGSKTPEVWGSTIGSAIMAKDSPEDFKTASFLGMLNGKVKNGGTDQNGYLTSDDSVLKNTKRNWVRGQESGEQTFVSPRVKQALAGVCSWHDPGVTYSQFSGYNVSDVSHMLSAVDATGMPVPAVFMRETSEPVSITYTGTPTLEYLEGERFDTGDHTKQSAGPDTDEPDSDSEFSVWVLFEDGTFAEITDYSIVYQNDGNAFAAGDTKVTVQASFEGLEFEKDYDVTVRTNELLSMEITGLPTSVLYAHGEYFSSNGMTVTTRYGSSERPAMSVKTTWKDGNAQMSC